MPHQFTLSSTSSSPFSSNNNTTTKNSSKLFSSTVRFFSHHLKLTRKSWLVILVVHFILMSLIIFYFRRHPRSSHSNLDQQQDSHSEQNSLVRSLLKFQTTTTTTDNHHHIMEDTDGVIHAFDPSHQRLELVRRNLFSRLNLSLEDHLATLEYMECSKLTFAERWYDPIVLSNPNMVQDRVENDSMLEFPNSTPLHVPYYLTRQHVHLFQPYTYPTPDKTEAKFAFKRRVRGFYNFIPVHVVMEEEEDGKGHQILSNGTIESNSEKNAHNHSTTRETSFSERTTTTAETNKPQVEKQHLENSFKNASETSSTTYVQIKETEFRNYFFTHRDKFRIISQLQVNDTTLLDWRDEMNNLNLVLNSEKFDMSLFGNHNEHLPIWLRCYKRTFPLSETLKAVCRVHDIEKSILYVTIDGNEFDEILELVTTVTCVKMHIYFHNFERNLRNLLGPRFDPSFLDLKIPKMSTHAIWGLHLLFVKFNYLYVITLEDDLKPLPDFYNYHRSMYHLTLDPSPSNIYIAVSSHAHSMAHHCRFINSTLVSEQLIPYEDSFDEYMYEKIISYGHNLNDNEGDLELAPFMIGSRRELPVFEIENFLNDVDATTTTSTTSTMSELKPDEEIAPVGSVHDPVTTGTLKKKEISEAAAEMSTEKKQIQVSNTPPSLRPSPVVASSSSSTIRAENSAIIPSLVVPSDMKIMDASVAAPRTETTTSSVQSLTPTPSSPLASLSTQQELHVKKNPNEQQKEHLVTTPQNKIQIVEAHQVSQQQQQLQQSTTRTTTEHPQTRSEIESTKSVNSTKVTKEPEPQHSLKSSSMEPPISSKNSNNEHKDTPPSPNNQEQTSEKSATTLSVKPIKEEEHGNDEKEENEQDLNQEEEEDESVDHDSELNSSSNDDDNDEQDTTEHPKDDDNDDDEDEEEVDQPEEVTEPHTTLDSKTFIHQQDDLQSLKKALQQVLQKNEPSLSSRKKNKTKQQDQHETQSSPQQQLQQPQQQQVENKVSEPFVTSSNHEESLTPQHAHHHLRKTLSAATNSESTMTTITPTTTTTTPTTSETSTKNNPLQFNTSTSTTSTTTTTTKNSTTNTENMMEQTQPPPRITRGPTSLYPTPDLGHPPHSIIPIKTPRQSFHMKPENFQCTWKDTHQVFLSQYHAIWGSGIPLRLFYRLWNAFIEYSIFKTDKLYFLGVLIRDLRKPHERSIMPCSDRITRIDNVGQNGEKNGEVRYWEISADFCEYYQEKERSEGISHKRQYVFVPS